MTAKLSDYRLANWREIECLYAANSAFAKYIEDVYIKLNSLLPGEVLIVKETVAPKNRMWFVKIVCMYITEGNEDVEFSHDYTRVRRRRTGIIQWTKRSNNDKTQELDQASGADSSDVSGWIESGRHSK